MPPCQGGCREFEPRLPLIKRSPEKGFFLLAEDSGEKLGLRVQATCEQRAKAWLRVALATKADNRRPVYCEQVKTASSPANYRG